MNGKKYIVVFDWMFNEMDLNPTEATIYGILYRFSGDGSSRYKGGSRYIADTLNVSQSTVARSLKKLLDNGLVKRECVDYRANIYDYWIDLNKLNEIEYAGMKLNTLSQNDSGVSQNDSYNTIDINNKYVIQNDSGVSQNDSGGDFNPYDSKMKLDKYREWGKAMLREVETGEGYAMTWELVVKGMLMYDEENSHNFRKIINIFAPHAASESDKRIHRNRREFEQHFKNWINSAPRHGKLNDFVQSKYRIA